MQQRHLLEDAGTELQALAWEAEQEQEYLRQLAGTEVCYSLASAISTQSDVVGMHCDADSKQSTAADMHVCYC